MITYGASSGAPSARGPTPEASAAASCAVSGPPAPSTYAPPAAPSGTSDADPSATLNDLREAVAMHEETERTARRVLGGTHPVTTGIKGNLREVRAALRASKVLQTSNELGAQLEI